MARPPRRAAVRAKAKIAPHIEADSDVEASSNLRARRSVSLSDDYVQPDHDSAPSVTGEQEMDDDILEVDFPQPRITSECVRTSSDVVLIEEHQRPARTSSKVAKAISVTDDGGVSGPRVSSNETKFGKKRHTNGSKENQVVSLLGDHVPLDYAMSQRSAWGLEVTGPSTALIQRYHGHSPARHGTPVSTASDQREMILEDVIAYADCLPPSRSVKVELVKPETLAISAHELEIFGVHDTALHSNHKSFTIHTGLSNRTLTWLPALGDTQYLAVGGTPVNAPNTPLFRFESGPGCIQIWSVVPRGQQRTTRLKIVYVHNFGHTWDLKWCPSLRKDGSVPGLLAGVFSDGIIRVWHVATKTASDVEAEFRKLDVPAYAFSSPETSCTTFDWISSKKLVAGCANGMFLVWDLENGARYPVSTGSPHTAFINNIVSCGPGAADVVITSSWDCDVKLSDIWRPDVEVLPAARERMVIYTVAWSEFLNSALLNDDSNAVKMLSMRAGYSTNLATTKGSVTTVATSHKHPFVAVGDASGTLMILNSCRKALMKKVPQFRRRVYHLDWASHEDAYRFTENYKIDELLGKMESKQFFATNIYPQQVNITKATWNNNPGFEGLLASCASVFVRIDDMTTP